MKIVGVDCATENTKIGLALGELDASSLKILDATLCSRERGAVSAVEDWISQDVAALVAIDAPLGWPKALADTLIEHTAGVTIETPANAMFRRATDRFIYDELTKTPLDVGADRIARTAHAALRLLSDLREALKSPIPLAWTPDVAGIAAIEVYPAATLLARSIRSTGYKKAGLSEARREILKGLLQHLTVLDSVGDLARNADLLDAVVCVLAGADFLRHEAMPPKDQPLAAE
jgi:predicted RNase H-like nuclease